MNYNYVPTPRIKISNEEKQKIIQCGHDRNALKDPSISRRKANIFSDDELDAIGALGEYAGCQAINAQFDWRVGYGGDGGVDAVLEDGSKIAIKFNHRSQGFLMVESRAGDTKDTLHDIENIDYIVLTTGTCDPPRHCKCREIIKNSLPVYIAIPGFLSKDEFLSLRKYKDWGLGGRWFVSTDQLHPISDLLAKGSK